MEHATYSPIECLPVELLVRILVESKAQKLSTDKGPLDDTLPDCQRPITNWAPLMLVSRRFHQVILATAAFWSRVPITDHLEKVQCYFTRSGKHPLDLWLKSSYEPAVHLILPYAPRVRSITTAPGFALNNSRSLGPLFDVVFPALEQAYIMPNLNTSPHSQDWNRLREVGSLLNETRHPQVNTLTSHRDLLPHRESAFWSSQLVHLDIRSQEGSITIERCNDILDVLAATPLLKSLAITFPDYSPPPGPLNAVWSGPIVYRQPALRKHLRTIRLSGSAWLNGYVLHALDTPSLDRLYIHTTALHEPNQDEALISMLPRRLHCVLAQHTRLHLHSGPDGMGYRLGDCHCETGRVSSDRLLLRVHSILPGVVLASPFHLLCSVFSEARLETLEVNYFARQPFGGANQWRRLMQTFPTLRKVTLFGNDQKSGAAMVEGIEALQREGLNPDLELFACNTEW